VCGLNPHNGDNGNYGDEEGRIIEPGVRLAAERGFHADGPFPADTAFVRAIRAEGGYDGVVTMYHDQGQIAMKLMGFERGVTVHGGLPIPITTPAHGTAYDIAGAGKANPGAMFNAFDLACRMGLSRRQAP
jgi:4-hydroxythreonine-4-phosphate dehydrogenase